MFCMYLSEETKIIRNHNMIHPVSIIKEKTYNLKVSEGTVCGICFDPIIRGIPTINDHSCLKKYCTDCYINWIESQIKDNANIIKCPTPGCKLTIGFKEINELANISNYKNLDTIHTRYQIRNYDPSKSSTLKLCPKNGCDSFVLLNTDNTVRGLINLSVKCKNNHEFCFNCENDEHYPYPCINFQKQEQREKQVQDFLDIESVKWIDKNTKKCPRCKIPIMKNGGCINVRCRCKTQFCWGRLNISDDHQLMTGRHNNIGCP